MLFYFKLFLIFLSASDRPPVASHGFTSRVLHIPMTMTMTMAVSPSPRRRWDSNIPTVFRPLVRAYLFGYASAVGPRLLTLLLQHAARHRRSKQQQQKQQQTGPTSDPQRDEAFLAGLRRILLGPLSCRSFPTSCAVLIGGATFLEVSLSICPPVSISMVPWPIPFSVSSGAHD